MYALSIRIYEGMIVWCTLLGIAWTVQTLPDLTYKLRLRRSSARHFFFYQSELSIRMMCVCVCVYTSDLRGCSMIISPSVLSPGSILQPLASQCFHSLKANFGVHFKHITFFFYIYKYCVNREMSGCQCVLWPLRLSCFLVTQCSLFITI
jgi:hypothetical protein